MKNNEIAQKSPISVKLDDSISDYSKKILLNISRKIYEEEISLDALSKITGISPGYLHNCFTGKQLNVSLKILLKLILILKMEPEEYLPEELLKAKKKTSYGEKFEFLIQSLPQEKKDFLLALVENYTELEKQNKIKNIEQRTKNDIEGQMKFSDLLE